MPPRGPRKPPITDAERRDILRRHARGESRNSIVAATGRSAGTVSKVVAETGGSFARSAEVVAATAAKVIDLAAKRAVTAHKFHDVGDKLLDQVFAPTTVYAFGGKENTFEHELVDEPCAADKRSLVGAAATAIDRSLKLEPPKDENGAEAVGSLLGGLLNQLRADHGDG